MSQTKTAKFTNFTDKDFIGHWDGKGKKYPAGQSLYMPDYLARHLALGLVNRELLEVRLDKDGNPMTKVNVDGRTVSIPKYEGGETMTSPKFPEQVPLFMKLFNQAYSPDASEEVGMSEDDIDTQIDVSN